MSALIEPDGSINPIFCFYLVENTERQLLTRAESPSLRKKKNYCPCAYRLIVPNQTEEAASFKRCWYSPKFPLGGSFGPLLQEYRLPPEVCFPLTEESNTGDHRNTTRPLIFSAAQWSVSPIAPASHNTLVCTL